MSSALFNTDAPRVMDWLKRDFGLTTTQAAGILGNIGRECGGFTDMVEDHGSGRGMCQWSGPRARQFEAFCKKRGASIHDLAANYGFLHLELSGAYAYCITALKRQATLSGATSSFMKTFEKPGIPALADRIRWGQLALAAHDRVHGTTHEAAEPVRASAHKLRQHRRLAAYHGALAHHHGVA